MSHSSVTRPALLGGEPIRPQGSPSWPRMDESVAESLQRLIRSGDWGRYEGPHGTALIRRLSEYHQVEAVHLCSSGTAAVELALRGMAVGPGDEVILAAYDFKANFQNVLTVSAVPVLVDIAADNGQIDSAQIEAAITDKTKAIIVSHLHGGIVDMPAVLAIARSKGLLVLEDACQNPGAFLDGHRAGCAGDLGVLSFGGSKLLTAGRGGAILTNRADLFERIRRYVRRGNDAYPLSEMQAAVLLPQLDSLDQFNEHRRLAVTELAARLKETSGLTFLQPLNSATLPVYYKVGFRYHAADFESLSRNRFAAALRAEGIAMNPGFRAFHLVHATRRFRAIGELIEATRADEEFLTLHHPILLEGPSGVDDIVAAIGKTRTFADEIASCRDLPSDCETTWDD